MHLHSLMFGLPDAHSEGLNTSAGMGLRRQTPCVCSNQFCIAPRLESMPPHQPNCRHWSASHACLSVIRGAWSRLYCIHTTAADLRGQSLTDTDHLFRMKAGESGVLLSGVPPMVPTMVRLPGQSRSMVQLLPPPADSTNPLTAVALARSAEVVPPAALLSTCQCCFTLPSAGRCCASGAMSSWHCRVFPDQWFSVLRVMHIEHRVADAICPDFVAGYQTF